MPDLGTHLALIRGWVGVDCATVNVSEDGFEHVMATMLEAGVGIDVGIWAMEDVRRFERSGFLRHVARVSVELGTGPRRTTCPVTRRRMLLRSTRHSTTSA